MADVQLNYREGAGDGDIAGGGAGRWAGVPGVELPPDFVPLFEPVAGCDARSLGYVGEARFVVFRYEPRAEEVVWDDGHTYGFGAGGWRDFLDRIAPLADRYAADLCLSGGAGGRDACAGADVLVLDRQTGSAYFAGRDSAERFLARLTGHARDDRRRADRRGDT